MRNIALAMLCKAIRLYASEHTTGTIIFSAQSLASMKGASRPITTTNPTCVLEATRRCALREVRGGGPFDRYK